MARTRELARCGALVCGSSRESAIQSVSPQETAEWCRSLASCGVRGVLLSSLQANILTQQIDGKRLDEILSTGDLQSLRLPDLNPRLLVAIRKAWRTDFGHVRFVPYSSPGVASVEQSGPISQIGFASKPPLPRCYNSAREHLDSRHVMSREGSHVPRETRSAGDLHYVEGSQCLLSPQLGQEDSLDSAFPVKPRAQISFAPPQPAVIPPRAGGQQHDSLDALLPAKAPAHISFPTLQTDLVMPNTSQPCQQDDSLDALFPTRSQAQASFAPQPVRTPPVETKGPSTGEGTSLADLFAPRPKALTTFAVQTREQQHACADNVLPRRRSPHPASEWNGASLSDVLKTPPRVTSQTGHLAADESSSDPSIDNSSTSRLRGAARFQQDWNGQGLGDVLAPRETARNSFAKTAETHTKDDSVGTSRHYKSDDGFEGSSLGDVLQKIPHKSDPTQHSTENKEQTQVQRSCRKSTEDAWGGASLGDALGSKAKPAPPQTECPKNVPQTTRGKNNHADGHNRESQKNPHEIVEWLRSLPVSHLPEQPREGIIAIVEEAAMAGNAFTEFVQKVDPALCGPKHAMKLKAAWNNVLAEAAATEVCRQNLDYAANHQKKAVAIKIAA